MKYALYSCKDVKNAIRKIDRAFNYFFSEIEKNERRLNFNDYEILLNYQILLLASKIVALQLSHVGVGDTATDEEIADVFEKKLKENKYKLKHKRYFFSKENIEYYCEKFYGLIH